MTILSYIAITFIYTTCVTTIISIIPVIISYIIIGVPIIIGVIIIYSSINSRSPS